MGDEIDSVTVTERDDVFVLDLEYRIAPLYEYVANKNAFGGFDVQCRKDGDAYYSTFYGKTTWANPQFQNPGLNLPDLPWYDFTIRVERERKDDGRGGDQSSWQRADHLAQHPQSVHGESRDYGRGTRDDPAGIAPDAAVSGCRPRWPTPDLGAAKALRRVSRRALKRRPPTRGGGAHGRR